MSTAPQGAPARSPVDRRQPQRSDHRRTAILAALDEHLRQTGFDALNIAEVARQAGVGRSAFYFYFENKAAAVAALLEPMHEALLAANTVLADTAEEPRSRVRHTLEAVAQTAEEHRYLFQAMWEARGANSAVRTMWDEARESFVPAVAAVIAAERAEGRAPDGADPRVLASLLMELNDRLVERIIVGGSLTRQQLLEGAEAMWMGTIYGTISETGSVSMTAAVSIPSKPTEVTAGWLSQILGTEVETVQTAPIGTGQTGATYRVSVTYRDDTGLPATFAVKLPSQDETVRDRVSIGYRSEHAFYTNVAAHVQIPTPQCHHCEIAAEGADFVLLLADMAPAEQGDQIAGCTPAEATLAVRALADLHGPTWADPQWANFPGIAMPKPEPDSAKGFGDIAKMAADITLDKLGERLRAEDRDTLSAAMSMVTPWLLAEPDRFAILHGDYRLDNMLFDPDRTRITVVDWQTLGSGLPARDLSYFTATSLDPAVRAAAEADLVGTYHDRLLTHGVTGYDRETCWQDYRLGMLQAPLLVVLGTAFATSTERGDDMMVVMAQRGCQAIRDLGTLDLING